MPFITKLDFSNNRQVKQYPDTVTALSGATVFGLPFAQLPVGPNLNTVITASTLYNLTSTFSGNSGTTVYSWADPRMYLGTSVLSALTPTISAATQYTGQIFTGGLTGTSYDGYSIYTSYSGVSFTIQPNLFVDLGGGNYSGTVFSNYAYFLSAGALDYSGRTLWVDVSGTSRTADLVVTKSPQIGYVWTCTTNEGGGAWTPVSGTSVSYWSADTSMNGIVLSNSESTAKGVGSVAEGGNTTASGTVSHSEGQSTQALGFASHAEGVATTAIGINSHSEGGLTIAYGTGAHAEGARTSAYGNTSHAEGEATTASGESSHTEGDYTTALGYASHAEGSGTTANGDASHSEGALTLAYGDSSHSGGRFSIASGLTSFVHGTNSIAQGASTIVLGDNITGTTNNYTYIERLNIKTVGSSAFVNDLRIDGSGYLTTNTSDERLKENIKEISNALNIVKQLRGVSYEWKDKKAGGDKIRLGFIAQEVEKVEPILVFTNPVDGYKGLNADGILPLLVESIKELSHALISGNTVLQTETIVAEDNNIELNFKGTQQSAIGGGLKIFNGLGEEAATLIIDANGNWTTNTDIIPNGLVIPLYTPSSTTDSKGNIGNITRDDNYMYLKTAGGWKRTSLETF